MKVEFEYPRSEDRVELMNAVDQIWKKGHALATSEKLMDWQHLDSGRDRYNFILARKDQKVIGMLGFIPNSVFDPSLEKQDTVWLTTWKVREDSGVAGLGLSLHHRLKKDRIFQVMGTVGNNKTVEKIYRAMGYKVGRLSHFVIKNDSINSFRILVGAEVCQGVTPSAGGVELFEVTPKDLSQVFEEIRADLSQPVYPTKSAKYFQARYFDHPYYQYRILGFRQADRVLAFFVSRRVEAKGAAVLRMVDFHGSAESMKGIYTPLQVYLNREEFEYADFYQHGLNDDTVRAAGWTPVELEGSLVAPNYFEPFVKQNVAIRYAYKLKEKGQMLLVKGDCDQDRPNVIQ